MKILSVVCVVAIVVGASLSVSNATLEDQIIRQLNYLTEKYADLEKKYAELDDKFKRLSEENIGLKSKIDLLSMKNKPTKTQNQPESFNFREKNENVSKAAYNFQSTKSARENDIKFEDSKKSKDTKGISVGVMKENLRNRVLRGSAVSQQVPVVAFTTSLTQELSLGEHETIKYDNVLTNIGHAYYPRHGHFIAPVKGLYLMTFSMANKQRSHLELEILKNGHRIGQAYGYGDEYNMGSQVIFVELESGDLVWVRHGVTNTEIVLGSDYNTFSGVLLAVLQIKNMTFHLMYYVH